MNRTKVLGVIVIFLLIASVVGFVIYSQYQASVNSHASAPVLTPTEPFTPTNQTVDFLSVGGWDTSPYTALVQANPAAVLTITTPLNTNWYYVSNDSVASTVTKLFTVDYKALAHGVSQTTKKETANIHLLNNIDVTTSGGKPPDELVVGIDNNNNLLVTEDDFSVNPTSPQTRLVSPQDGIKAPASGHIIISVSGIDTQTEAVVIENGDTKNIITTKQLVNPVFSTQKLYIEVSVENNTSDPKGAIMTVSKLLLTTN